MWPLQGADTVQYTCMKNSLLELCFGAFDRANTRKLEDNHKAIETTCKNVNASEALSTCAFLNTVQAQNILLPNIDPQQTIFRESATALACDLTYRPSVRTTRTRPPSSCPACALNPPPSQYSLHGCFKPSCTRAHSDTSRAYRSQEFKPSSTTLLDFSSAPNRPAALIVLLLSRALPSNKRVEQLLP